MEGRSSSELQKEPNEQIDVQVPPLKSSSSQKTSIRKAPMNRTIELSLADKDRLRPRLIRREPRCRPEQSPTATLATAPQGTIYGDCFEWVNLLPHSFVDLLILDPPYNLNKDFHGEKFFKQSVESYTDWIDQVLSQLKRLLKSSASIYICGDWFSSHSIFTAASHHFIVRNRITWEREKGRGARSNWKNASEDIWFCTVSERYTFNPSAVKLRRRVVAPYRLSDGTPKDWQATQTGNFRDTHPSNLWTDITIPFWSMPENTKHPTQKSEKLMAKLLLASSNVGDFVFDPFQGSGTSSVVAKKLGRKYLGIELNEEYCLLTERRLELADLHPEIQGFTNGVFWERNTLALQQKAQINHAP